MSDAFMRAASVAARPTRGPPGGSGDPALWTTYRQGPGPPAAASSTRRAVLARQPRSHADDGGARGLGGALGESAPPAFSGASDASSRRRLVASQVDARGAGW